MMVRKLSPTEDLALYCTAYHWDDDAPRWRQDCEAVFGCATEAEYLAQLADPTRLDIGAFYANELCALITLHLVAPQTFEVHLAARRGTPLEIVYTAGCYIRDHAPAGTKFIWLPSRNSAIVRLARAIGFWPDGWVMWRGSTHGRAIEWHRWSLTEATHQ